MKHRFMFLSCLWGLLALSSVWAQGEGSRPLVPARHAVIAESNWFFWGSGTVLFHTLTYEYEYWRGKNVPLQLGVRLGAGFQQDLPGYWVGGPWIPLAHRLSLGARTHRFECILGAAYTAHYYVPVWPLVQLGYRHQLPESGLIWRVHLGTTGVGASAGWAF